MRTPRVMVALAALAGLAAGCGDNHLVAADELTVSPTTLSLEPGDVGTVAATYRFGDATTPADDVVWTTSDATIATVTGAGASATVTGVAGGTATITATGLGLTANVAVTVTGGSIESIAITPPAPTLAAGTTLQLTATATYTDGSTVDVTGLATWFSDDEVVATVDAAGLLAGVANGSTTIAAAVGTVSGTTTVTVTDATLVSLEISPEAPTVADGLEQQFTATGVFSDTSVQDLTDQVTWMSSDTAVATISNDAGSEGLATTSAPGTTTISAMFGLIGDSTLLTVTDTVIVSIEVLPASATVPAGLDQAYTATATFSDSSTAEITTQATWASTDPGVATISNDAGSEGLATAEVPGTTTISATLDGVTGMTGLTVSDAALVSLVVSPEEPSVPEGVPQQFTATGTFTDGSMADITTQVTWDSSDTGVATISNATGSEGRASTAGLGTTTISATSGAIGDSTTLTVTDAVLESINVTPPDRTLSLGLTQQYTAVGTFTDGSTQALTSAVLWESSDETVATISNAPGSRGRATTLGGGTTTISATLDGVTGDTSLTVSLCHLVINEVQVRGANTADEFVEIHNPCNFSMLTTGWRLVYRSPTGTADITLATLITPFTPGTYRLFAGLGYDGSPVVDDTFGGAGGSLGNSGGLAIRAGVANTGPVMDAVGWGTATNAYVETAPAPSPLPDDSIARQPNASDTDNNLVDFVLDLTPSPRAEN